MPRVDLDIYIKLIARMSLVSYKNCHSIYKLIRTLWESKPIGRLWLVCYASVDGTDLLIREPIFCDKGCSSYKFRGSGLRIEIAVSILLGQIVSIVGPSPCGFFNQSMFNLG